MSDNEELKRIVCQLFMEELGVAEDKYSSFNSAHEGCAIVRERFEEMWEAVKKDDLDLAAKKCIQVGAMAVRFVVDLNLKDTMTFRRLSGEE